MKIDIFSHVQPERYKKALYKHSDKFVTVKKVQDKCQALTDQKRKRKGQSRNLDLKGFKFTPQSRESR